MCSREEAYHQHSFPTAALTKPRTCNGSKWHLLILTRCVGQGLGTGVQLGPLLKPGVGRPGVFFFFFSGGSGDEPPLLSEPIPPGCELRSISLLSAEGCRAPGASSWAPHLRTSSESSSHQNLSDLFYCSIDPTPARGSSLLEGFV